MKSLLIDFRIATNLKTGSSRKYSRKILFIDSETSTTKVIHLKVQKQDALCIDYKNGGLKNVDIKLKIVLLKCSRIRKLYNKLHNDWKIIPQTI